ncbi:hypothetical protein EDD85DRAFT_960831 [Armillaria nabsnona]|nr:hypothetical protein EDD85DRAFT_960831 [Armillaria nabsnona]
MASKPDGDALVDGPVTPKQQTSSFPMSLNSGPSHSTPTTARKKRRPQSEIDAEKKVKEAKKERDTAYKASLVAWKEIANFRLPENISTITKGDAKKQYKLNDRDMGTLEFERRISNNGNNMNLYSVKVQGLCRRKQGKLPDTVSDFDITPQAYTPPQLGSAKDTLPQDFAYRPTTRRLTELEAMNLFLLRRCELYGLERNQPDGNDWNHPDSDGGVGPILYSGDTLDYRAVQQRAMGCHGGFSEHNKMIFEKAKPAVTAVRASQGDYSYDLFPREILKRFAMSPKDLKEKPWAKDVQDRSLIEVWWPPYEVITDDYGASDLYAPGFD